MQTQITTYNNWMKMLSDEGNNNIRSIKDAAITDGSILVSILRTFILTTTAIIINWTQAPSARKILLHIMLQSPLSQKTIARAKELLCEAIELIQTVLAYL